MNYLIAIVGPTAVGKTELAVQLAKRMQTEVISGDSRQVFRELSIGTAKPNSKQLASVRHHLVDSHTILDAFDAAEFEREGLKALKKIFRDHQVAVLVGGSGLYIKVLCEGIDEIPPVPETLGEQLALQYQTEGLYNLKEELRQNDPLYYEVVDRNNPHRVLRALEVLRATGKPFSTFLSGKSTKRDFETVKIGLEMTREELYERIDNRVENMVARGLFDEVQSLLEYRHLNALQTVGYQEVFDFFDGRYVQEEAIRLVKRNTRRYAKRQITWFKRDSEVKWFHAGNSAEIENYVISRISL